MIRRGFTIIELLVVLAIIAVIAGLITVGMGDILHRARVQRSAAALVQTFSLGQQMAASYRRVYTIAFNSAKPPGTAAGQTTPLSWDAGDREYGDWGGNSDLNHSQTTPAPLWSNRPEDQWYALMGPWQDSDGRWWQVRGGMPRRNATNSFRAANSRGYGDGADQHGGAFGPAAPTPTSLVPGASNSWDPGFYPNVRVKPPADWTTTWQWDPYGVQVGQRRFLTRGTRWVARFDAPEWAAFGTNSAPGDPNTSTKRMYGMLTANFLRAMPAHVTIGRSNGYNEWAQTTGFNIYPNGFIDRNQCPNVESYAPCGQNFDGTTMGWVGICSSTTRPASFQPFLSSGLPDVSKSAQPYNRPVSMLWLTIFSNGQVVVRPCPRKGP